MPKSKSSIQRIGADDPRLLKGGLVSLLAACKGTRVAAHRPRAAARDARLYGDYGLFFVNSLATSMKRAPSEMPSK